MLSSSQSLSTMDVEKNRISYQRLFVEIFITKKRNLRNILNYLKLECHDSSKSYNFRKNI